MKRSATATRSSNARAVAEEGLEDVGTHIREIGTILKQTVEHKLEELKDGAVSVRNTGTESVEHARDRVVKYVRDKPLQSVMIAIGAGAVLGLLLRRN